MNENEETGIIPTGQPLYFNLACRLSLDADHWGKDSTRASQVLLTGLQSTGQLVTSSLVFLSIRNQEVRTSECGILAAPKPKSALNAPKAFIVVSKLAHGPSRGAKP